MRGNEEFGTMLYLIFIHQPYYTKYIQTNTHFPFCFYDDITWSRFRFSSGHPVNGDLIDCAVKFPNCGAQCRNAEIIILLLHHHNHYIAISGMVHSSIYRYTICLNSLAKY